MSARTIVTKYGLIAAISAVTAAGALAIPGAAHAKPGDCVQYGWPDRYQLIADNGLVIEGGGPVGGGKTAIGFAIVKLPPAMAIVANPGMRMQGAVTIEGKNISGETKGDSGETIFSIDGTVGSDGVGHGRIESFWGGANAGFGESKYVPYHTDRKLSCLNTEQAVQAPKPAPDPEAPKLPVKCAEGSPVPEVPFGQTCPAPPAALTATVNPATDLYDKPNDNGDAQVIDVLETGQVVTVEQPCSKNAWCILTDPKGAAWGRDLTNN